MPLVASADVGDVVNTAADTTGNAVNTAADTTANAVNTAADTTGNVVNTAADTTGNAVNTAADTTGNVVNTAADTTGNVVNTAADTTGNVVNTAADTTGNVVNTAADTTANAVNTAADTTGNVVNTAADTTGNVVDTAADTTGNVVNTAADTTGNVGEAPWVTRWVRAPARSTAVPPAITRTALRVPAHQQPLTTARATGSGTTPRLPLDRILGGRSSGTPMSESTCPSSGTRSGQGPVVRNRRRIRASSINGWSASVCSSASGSSPTRVLRCSATSSRAPVSGSSD